jgi:predicted phosphate transport protein (TIGR00153 family)
MPSYLTNLFGRSPITPLQQHMAKVHACVSQLEPFFKAVVENDQQSVAKIRKQIADLENEADELKWQLRHHLPTGLFMPVDRRDLLEVLTMQDKIANQAKDIAGLVLGRRMTIPESMQALFLTYGNRSIAASAQALSVIQELDELVETGFRGVEVDKVQKMIEELNSIEGDTDKLQIQLRDILFGLEDDLRPTDVMFTYRLIEGVGKVADLAQRVGSRLQLLLAR